MQNGHLPKSLLAGLIALVLLLVTGVGLSAPAQAGDATITPTPTPGVILFEDDFATYSGRWTLTETAKASVTYDAETLNLRVVSPGVFVWSVPDFDTPLRDYRLDVMADIREGSADSVFGFVVDYQDDEHYYVLLTTTQGDWQVLRRYEGEWINLTPADAEPVQRGENDSPVMLRVDVIGDSVTLFVDDQEAGRVALEDGQSGAVFGLVARAGRGYVDVSFDDFRVTAED
ncbi:MAG: hypothetical protein EHM39_10830 [Chloroflexi bacterium]|nr:MAG: hypothetical protein EHM39_10830 [Chloroflexota bacterium]